MRLIVLACLLSISVASASEEQPCGDCGARIQSLKTELEGLPPGDVRTPDLLFRLGETYRAVSAFRRSEGGQEDTPLGALERDAEAKEQGLQAEAQYKRIIEGHPRFARREEVFSALIGLHLEMAQPSKAMEVTERLARESPRSPLLSAGYLAIAEDSFERAEGDRGLLEKARDFYKKAAAVPDSPDRLFPLYMQGWCSYQLEQFSDAQAAWKALVRASRSRTLSKLDQGRAPVLTDDALLNHALVSALLGDANTARGELSRLASGNEERIALTALLDLFYRQHGEARKREAQVTLAALQADCTAGQGRACNALGLLHAEGLGMKTDMPRAVKLFQTACARGLASGCHNLCAQDPAVHAKACSTAARLDSQQRAKPLAFWESLERVGRQELPAFSLLKDGPGGVDGVRGALLKTTKEREPPPPPPVEPLPGRSLKFSSEHQERDIQSVMVSQGSALQFCYEEALKRRGALSGRLVVKFVVGAQGSVETAEVVSSTLEDAVMEACVLSRIKLWDFPASTSGRTTQVLYPFIFTLAPRRPHP